VACFNKRVMSKGALLRRMDRRDDGPQIEDFSPQRAALQYRKVADRFRPEGKGRQRRRGQFERRE